MSSAARVNAFADYAALSAYGDARWLDPGASLPGGDDFPTSDIAPAPGGKRMINLILPAGADLKAPFWAVFEPTLAVVNGWSDCPETLDVSAFVRCRALAIASPGSVGRTPAWLSVVVDDVLPLPSLIEHFPARRIERLETWELDRGELVQHGDWELLFAPHDDAGHWLLARHSQEDNDRISSPPANGFGA